MSERYTWSIQVMAQDHLDDWFEEFLEDVTLQRLPDGTTQISGTLQDVPAVYGFILRLRDGGIRLVSLQVERSNQHEEEE